jgi:L-fuconolactonase
MLTDLSPETTAAWHSGLSELAAMPNLYSKLSAFGTFVHRNDPALISYIVDNAISIFGSERLMFGSNFPIEKLWTGHSALMKAHRDAVAKHGEAHAANIFWNTAERVYRI